MDDTGNLNEMDAKNPYKRPGPRLSACQWCGKVSCNHCRCTGQANCSHAPGEMCKNQRYKRRLVCNPCEKNKLKCRQMCQQNSEKKGSTYTLLSNVELNQGKLLPGNGTQSTPADSTQITTEEVLTHSCKVILLSSYCRFMSKSECSSYVL